MELVSGKSAAITGGASGIGLALATALLARGMNVAVLDVENEALSNALTLLEAHPGRALLVEADVTDRAMMIEAATNVNSAFGPVDLLVNNAGVGGALGPAWSLDHSDWAWTLDVNVLGVANGLAAFLPAMIERRSGHVLNIASLAGLVAPPFLGPYTASKYAVVGLTTGLATELAALGTAIGVSVACPAVVTSGIGNSDRDRPPKYASQANLDPALALGLKEAFSDMTAYPMPADACADRIILGLEAGQRFIITHDESRATIANHTQDMIEQMGATKSVAVGRNDRCSRA